MEFIKASRNADLDVEQACLKDSSGF